MLVLTVGKTYIDIDGYASCIAYRELLKMQGIDSKFVSNSELNYSITDNLKSLPFYIDKYNVKPTDKFIIIDLSNKQYFPEFVKEKDIIEIIDHHSGYEEYWKEKLGDKAIIEPIGSVATIIVEKYEELKLLHKMNLDVAKLLMSAILDNTLNFTAEITTIRDKNAYKKLEEITGLKDYKSLYFNNCQEYVEMNLEEAIKNDIKFLNSEINLPKVIGQLTVWNAESLFNNKKEIIKIMNSFGDEWILNVISLDNNTSYIMCSNEDIKNKIKLILKCNSDDNLVITLPAILRKEIMKKETCGSR